MYKEVIQENDGARHETLMQNTQQKISSDNQIFLMKKK